MFYLSVTLHFILSLLIVLTLKVVTGFEPVAIYFAVVIYLVGSWMLFPLTKVKCKLCDSSISKKAKICPNCQSHIHPVRTG